MSRIAQIKGAADLRSQQITVVDEVRRLQEQMTPMDAEIAKTEAARIQAQSQLAVVKGNQDAMASENAKREETTQRAIAAVAQLEKDAEALKQEKLGMEERVANLRNVIATKKKEIESIGCYYFISF